MSEQLRVRVNEELVLNAGMCEEAPGPDGPERIIRPPKTTLFHQVLAYLRGKPDPWKRPGGSMVGREGVAATALALRWGSYLAVLLDHDKPIWPAVESPGTSRISDGEMARINIEASAALAEWIDIYRAHPGGRLYEQLVNRTVSCAATLRRPASDFAPSVRCSRTRPTRTSFATKSSSSRL